MPSRTANSSSARASTAWMKTIASIKSGVPLSPAGAGNALAKVVDGQAESLLQRNAWFPHQVSPRTPIVKGDPVHVALPARSVLGFELVVREDRELPIELVDADVYSSADVIRAARAVLERGQVCGRRVADMQHVAGLISVAVDCERLALEHP